MTDPIFHPRQFGRQLAGNPTPTIETWRPHSPTPLVCGDAAALVNPIGWREGPLAPPGLKLPSYLFAMSFRCQPIPSDQGVRHVAAQLVRAMKIAPRKTASHAVVAAKKPHLDFRQFTPGN
jgi:hypothetical protein